MYVHRACGGFPVLIELEALETRRLMSAAAAAGAAGGRPDPVLEWNNVLIAALRADQTHAGPGFSSRTGAIMHAAIFDAVNAIDGSYAPFLVDARASRSTPIDAAVAAAGWRTLCTLYPLQKSTFDTGLATTLARVPNGRREDAGVALGVSVADQILAARADDGSDAIVPYTPGTDPGDWQPTGPDFTDAWGPGWGAVTPFSMVSGAQFRPPPAPALTSAEYTAAFNEVKSLGAKNSTTRTAEQTQISIFWGYDRPGMGTPPTMYNQLVQTIARQQHNTTAQNARLFALANLAMADAGIAAWDCKYIDNLWRPVTAIRAADTDGNPDTVADPAWEPLGAPGGGIIPNFTPPFPAYVSGHATFGAAVCEVLKDFYHTDKIHFTLISDELPGVTRSFNSFTQAAAENGVSRIYLGIHWQFDNTEGQNLGRQIADFVFAHALTSQAAGHSDHVPGPPVTFMPASLSGVHVITLIDKPQDDLIAL